MFRHGLAIDRTGEKLVMGASTGGLWFSDNAGEKWGLVSGYLPQVYCVEHVG